MDTDLATGLIVNPSDVKVEPASPGPSPSTTPAPSVNPVTVVQTKLEPELCHIKQEPRAVQSSQGSGHSVLKQPSTIVISSSGAPGVTRTLSSSTTRLLVPKLPANTTVKLEAGGPEQRWRLGQNTGGRILVTGGIKSSTRRVIDSHLISSHTVRIRHYDSQYINSITDLYCIKQRIYPLFPEK